jgi:hypothetical protein
MIKIDALFVMLRAVIAAYDRIKQAALKGGKQ